jgi:hypothetical protein
LVGIIYVVHLAVHSRILGKVSVTYTTKVAQAVNVVNKFLREKTVIRADYSGFQSIEHIHIPFAKYRAGTT